MLGSRFVRLTFGKVGMTPDHFRLIALSHPEATEGAHHGKVDFRIRNRVFATIGYPPLSMAW